MIRTMLLSAAEFRSTFRAPMVDITQREEEFEPEGVLDLRPYIRAVPQADLGGFRLMGIDTVESVYRSGDGAFDHVMYPCKVKNVYLVVVVDLAKDKPFGHFLLNLNDEYGQSLVRRDEGT